MYHCHIQLYLIGGQRDLWEQVKTMPPLERFTHSFLESSRPEPALLAQADVILADLRDADGETMLAELSGGKKAGAELILLADGTQLQALVQAGELVTDVWTLPMSPEELRFRFRRWQRAYKQSRDLWQAEQFLEAGMDGSPNLVWYKNRDGVHVRVNQSFCNTVHKSKQQVQGSKHAYIWDVEEEDPACIESELEVMSKRETCMSHESVQAGDGEMLLRTYKSPLYDLDGSVMGTVGVAMNITKERSYEQEILEKNRTLEMLFATIDCGVMLHSMDGTQVVSINQAALRLLGYETQEELLEDGFDLIARSVVEEDREELRKRIHSLTKVGENISAVYRVRHQDGELLYIFGNIKIVEKNGQLFYQRFLLDYTAQKRREEEQWAKKDQEFQYQEQMFEIFSTFLARNVDDVYMMLDAAGHRVEYVSPNIERILGVSAEDVLEDANRIGHAEYITGHEVSNRDLEALTPGMALERMETKRVNFRSGEEKWLYENVYCVEVQGIKKIVAYISDRTKERMAQNALIEALDMAQVASKAKSAFLSNVSHDIRTPMNAIMGFVTLMREEVNSPERVLEYTQKISAASQHLLGLINDVLDMNKIESGTAVLSISELKLAKIVEEVNAIIRPQARAKNQSFEVFTSSLTNEHLLGDELRIIQILINILSNAVKYTQNGGTIKMWVNELPQVDKSYSRIRFTISDNGQGMSEEYQKVIFEPFTREQSSVWNKIQGTGLGMAITKSLVDLMNGTIKVTSKLGEGSIFVVELELRIQEKEDDPEFWKKHNVSRILITDDDEDVRNDILKKMADTGVDAQCAADGAKTLEMIHTAREEGRPYDLLLLDWKMPDLDGLATARLIRKNYPDPIPILLFTAFDWADVEQEAREVDISYSLPKPFFMSNFKDVIRRMAEKSPKSAQTSGEKSLLKGKHVLVVDDIDINRLILMKILNNMGAECDVAEDGQEAVEKFKASQPGRYDIIFMDIQMPNMNGHEATRAIRASGHPSAQSIPVIAMTANAFVDDIRAALEAGMDAHVAKPIVLERLERTIQEVLERRKADEPGEA